MTNSIAIGMVNSKFVPDICPNGRVLRQGRKTGFFRGFKKYRGVKGRSSKIVRGGGGEIRTPGPRERSTVFKTAAINHSATPPNTSV